MALQAEPSEHVAGNLQVLGKIFFSLHRAEMGLAGEKEDDLFLPQNVRIPAFGAPAAVKQQCSLEGVKRGPLSLVASLFGLDVQVSHSIIQPCIQSQE